MIGRVNEHAPGRSPTTLLVITCVVIWPAAAASAGTLGIWLAVGGAAVGLGVAALVLDGEATRRLLSPNPRLLLIGAAAGGVMAGGTYLLYPAFSRLSPSIATDTASLYASFRAPPPLMAALALLPVIVGEELAWRGVVQTAIARRLGPWPGVTVGAGVYALAHAPLGSPVLVAVALLCGMAWGTLRAATASLVPPLLAHVVWDAVVLLWLPLDLK